MKGTGHRTGGIQGIQDTRFSKGHMTTGRIQDTGRVQDTGRIQQTRYRKDA